MIVSFFLGLVFMGVALLVGGLTDRGSLSLVTGGTTFSILIAAAFCAAVGYVPPGFRWLARLTGKGFCRLGLHKPLGPPRLMTRETAEKIQDNGFDDCCSRCGAKLHWFPLGDKTNGYRRRCC